MSKGKAVNEIKGEVKKDKPNNQIQINPGNIPILTVQLLDAINRNLIVLVQQNAKILEKLNG